MFGRRQKYYETALNITREYFQIETDNTINPYFPGYLVYMDLLSEAYHIKKATAEEAAVMLVMGYWAGVVENVPSLRGEMIVLKIRLLEFIRSSKASKRFDSSRAELFSSRIEGHARQFNV